MVIAGNSGQAAYGVRRKNKHRCEPLMVLPIPYQGRLLQKRPVTLAVTSFCMENKIKEVTLKIKPDPSL